MTSPDPAPTRRVAFGDLVADVQTGELWRGTDRIAIQDLPFRVLAAVLETPGALVSRKELAARLWGTGTFVDAEAGINTAVAKLRQALEEAGSPGLIETVPKRGYRFTGSLSVVDRPIATATMAPASQDPVPAPRSRVWWGRAASIVVALGLAGGVYQLLLARSAPIRVAVVLFDNETGLTELDALAQRFTDATVMALTANDRLAIIGNAAVLRTTRPFRDVEKIRDALDADFVIIGQVQLAEEKRRVVTHLIRASDQAHVWIKFFPFADRSEAAVEADMTQQVGAAVGTAILARP